MRPRRVIGLGVGATISVKALLAPIILPAALVLLAGRRLAPILAAAGTAIGLHFVLWLPWGPAAALDRCRWPSWKFATFRVLSIAALGVTVTITTPEGSGRSEPEGVER